MQSLLSFFLLLLFSINLQCQISSNNKNLNIKVPQGFLIQEIAKDIGRARHIAITPQGVIYIKSSKLKNGKGIFQLQLKGKEIAVESFGNYEGTGIAIKKGYLYATSNEEVFRYKLDNYGKVINKNQPELIITGLINRRQHASKSITLDEDDNIYVNIGAYSNSCQIDDRTQGSLGKNPCSILDSAGGIWKFKTNKLNQTYAQGMRYATGLRNVVGLDWNTQTNSLFVMQHGRDQLHDLFPEIYDTKQSADLPSECMYELHNGDNCGWPYIYYDHFQNKKIIAPEYGGDAKKSTEDYLNPVIAFPAHLAPNGLLFYTGNQFPDRYKNGAFIAFHGSWNRAPEPQEGYYVVFVPFKEGKPIGNWEIFADGFAGKEITPRAAKHRPCGLAQDSDGALYVTDDTKGSIFKITYKK